MRHGKPKDDESACKVTMQYRLRSSFVYELETAGVALAVHISQGATEHDGGWLVAAHNGTTADAIVIDQSAPTRAEALQKVGRSWRERSPELGLARFDWDAVAAALLAVRAI